MGASHDAGGAGTAIVSRPTGRVAFLFTDVESSTDIWERNPHHMTTAIRLHDEVNRQVFERNTGYVFSTAGDGFAVAFADVADATAAAIDLQRTLDSTDFPGELPIRTRVGIHVGEAMEERDGDYFGVDVNRAARVMAVASGGQVILSAAAVDELGAPPAGTNLVDLGRARLKGIATPVPLHQLSIEGLRTDFPAIASDRRPNTTPAFATSLVGRDDDLAELLRLLGSHRVVTLLAPGGMGKSRLAGAVGRATDGTYPGGIYFVELADSGPGSVTRLLAGTVLGDEPLAQTTQAGDPLANVIHYVGDRRTLLILDNCEHVLEEVASTVSRVLTACPETVVLATSRQHLGVAGEQRYRVRQLPVGVHGDHGPAVELFLARARSVDPDFEPDDGELAEVERICERLEGIPLAIELAASRLAVLSVGEIADRLDDAVALLRERHSKRPERHRSMIAAIEWSYENLDADERDLFVRLASFAGGFDLAAAAAMTAAAGMDPAVALDLMQALVDKSLVVVRRNATGTRYHLLEPIRQFAEARLDAAELKTDTWEVHREHFKRMVTLGVPEIDGPPGPDAIDRIEADHDNIMAAIDRHAPERALSMVSRMSTYWEESGRLAEGADLAIGLLDRTSDPITRLRYVGLPMAYSTMVGRQRDAERLAEEAIAALPHLPPPAAGMMSFSLGFVDNAAGRFDDCQQRWTDAAEAVADVYPLTARTALLSAVYHTSVNGRYDRADELLEQALQVEGPKQGWFEDQHTGFAHVNASLQGDRLHPGLADSFDRIAESGLRFRTLLMSGGTALAAFRHQEFTLAVRAWRLGLDIAREMGHVWAAYLLGEFAAWSSAVDGDEEHARWIAGSLDAIGSEQGWQPHDVVVEMRSSYISSRTGSRPHGSILDVVAAVTDNNSAVDRLARDA